MAQVILLADNDEIFRNSLEELLKLSGYDVKIATNPQTTRDLLSRGGIDLAILDVRLVNDRNPLDKSGYKIATEGRFRHIPKIMLTAYRSSYADQRMLEDRNYNEPHFPIRWINKDEDPENILEEIPRILSIWEQIQKVQILASKIYHQIKRDHNTIRLQAYINYALTLVFATAGFTLIIRSIALSLSDNLNIAIVGAISGIITEFLGVLVYQQLNHSNKRMDKYHRELLQTHGLELLLATSEKLSQEKQDSTIERVILAATESWFSLLPLPEEPR
jgi:CheY-like chemotaxis protein